VYHLWPSQTYIKQNYPFIQTFEQKHQSHWRCPHSLKHRSHTQKHSHTVWQPF